MTWCDKLASTPAVALFLEPQSVPSHLILAALSPRLDDWARRTGSRFSVARQETYLLQIQRDDGYLFTIEQSKFSITFQHRMTFKPTSGGLPIGELISHSDVYTKILEGVITELAEVAMLLSKVQQRQVKGFGISSTTRVSWEDVPPGLKLLEEYITKPWKAGLSSYEFSVSSLLKEDSLGIRKCINRIIRPEEGLSNIVFDWQIWFSKLRLLDQASTYRDLDKSKEEALSYFEELAIGDYLE